MVCADAGETVAGMQDGSIALVGSSLQECRSTSSARSPSLLS